MWSHRRVLPWFVGAREGCISSPIVPKASGLKATGDWLLVGSGDVPHEELGPPLELEEHDGDEEDVAAPGLCEFTLPRAADAMTLSVRGGLKMPENLARSSLVCASRPVDWVEPWLPVLSEGLTWSLGVREVLEEAERCPV